MISITETEIAPKIFIEIDVHKRQWSVRNLFKHAHHIIFNQSAPAGNPKDLP
ncbi:hypothetical protein IFO69_02935 [Echinicola sp. CAU 1574]|uniref:Uncharacterized protein n=1 Tax=Echinicola arenosa TaxID=2774144 RepID=A0ABR9AG44_9BACT|nr:hypothetical protein [Echinicola arenosa]MBD8487696.1 hypothetical protein [Echinicola arenosa]